MIGYAVGFVVSVEVVQIHLSRTKPVEKIETAAGGVNLD